MRVPLIAILSAAALSAVPQLRLSTPAITINIAGGHNGPTQSVTTSNIGDGTLVLSASSDVSWIGTSIAGADVLMTMNTGLLVPPGNLANGAFTGIVTVTAANAIDSPQTITVTVLLGGGVPWSLDLYLAPGGAGAALFTASNAMDITAAITYDRSKSLTLAVSSTAAGSFATTASYQVRATAAASTPPDDSYFGALTVTGSPFSQDIHAVNVTLHVTTLPIVTLAPASLQFEVTGSGAPVTKWIQLTNSGMGALAVGALTTAILPLSDPAWLTASMSGTTLTITGDPAGLRPGPHRATVTLPSNAANGPFTVPVEMDVIAAAPPLSYYQGVVDNALFEVGAPVAPGGLVAVRGEQFTTGAAMSALSLPLGTTLGRATVYVNGVAAPIYYVSASHVVNQGGQLTFQMPYGTAAGQATVRVDRNDNGTVLTGNTISAQVTDAAPRLLQFSEGGTEYAVATFTDFVTFPIPPTNGVAAGQRGRETF